MSLIKLGEAITIKSSDLQSEASVISDPEMLARFEKFASEIKAIAPKANDFLYFSAIMMHAAEAALLNPDGSIKKDASGKEVSASWEKTQDQHGRESIKWVCSDPSIKPTKNANGDIFPEFALVEAHKKWIGKPLCLDHKSSSVDMIRGLIIDTYYDRPHKRIIALCALDKVNYPDLARKVSTGYATSVSMGTAVSTAVCFDCGRAANVEGDFCHHMRTKSSYGEINLGLNPIELSIVVNGADPHAKIRHIVAAANHIAEYVDSKQKEFNKIAIDETPDINAAQNISEGIDKIKGELDSLKTQIEDLKKREEEEQKTHDEKSEQQNTVDSEENTKTSSLKYSQDSIKLANVIGDIYQNLTNLQNQISKLSKKQDNEETEMTNKKAYWQGGGGVNEPTPGAVKYPKEEADKVRDTEDKHMQSPANFGPVDGMFPGDEQKKRALQRLAAEREERALRRQAALEKAKNKVAYMQGGGGVNEPTLGKPKYPKEEADKIRDTEDKHMQGAAPFPNVGKVDGLYGDDEKKKKLLSRASKLSAKFVKAANSDGTDDQANSLWQVFADKKLILSASVKDLTGGKIEALYDSVATDEFGKRLMKTIRAEGLDKALVIFKGAQAAPASGPAPALNMGQPESAPVEAPVAQLPETSDEGGKGDPKDELMDKLDEAESVLSDIRAGVSALTNEGNNLEDFDQLQSEAPELVEQQNKLSRALLVGMRKIATQLDNHVKELKLAKDIYDNYDLVRESDVNYVNDLTKEACEDTHKIIGECRKYMRAFVQYAEGSKILLTKEAAMKKSAQLLNQDPTIPANFKVHNPGDPLDSDLGQYAPSTKPKAPTPSIKPPVLAPKKPAPKLVPVKPQSPADELPMPYGDRSALETMLINNTQQSPMSAPGATPIAPGHEVQYAKDHMEEDEDCNDAVQVDKDGKMTADSPEEAGKAMKAMKSTAAEFDLHTKEGRAQLRAKLAEKAMSVTDLMNKAHGTSGPMIGNLDVKPSGNLSKVENLQEVQNAMMEVVNATPKVKKQAADIQKLVIAGKIDPEKDFSALVAKGLDNEAVKYWKAFYGQAKDGGSQFAAELVKEHEQQKMAEEQKSYQVKIARAYEVAYEMSNKGMIGNDKAAVKQQVDELMSFNDKAFESVQSWVSRQAMKKQASIPQVGIRGNEEYFETRTTSQSYQDNMTDELRAIFANRKY